MVSLTSFQREPNLTKHGSHEVLSYQNCQKKRKVFLLVPSPRNAESVKENVILPILNDPYLLDKIFVSSSCIAKSAVCCNHIILFHIRISTVKSLLRYGELISKLDRTP